MNVLVDGDPGALIAEIAHHHVVALLIRQVIRWNECLERVWLVLPFVSERYQHDRHGRRDDEEFGLKEELTRPLEVFQRRSSFVCGCGCIQLEIR
jgi:hypothetical protein